MRSILIVALLLPLLQGEFTKDFEKFLTSIYGAPGEANLERYDMGAMWGSFGGREEPGQPINNRPIVFIHGVTLRASVFLPHRSYFIERGYSPAELYATTYGDGGFTPMYYMSLRCSDVKLVRNFIKGVQQYTNSSIDVLAYSMGVAITRKAILGGRCVDTNEDLGEPLTDLVNTYLDVAGVAYGMQNCPERYPNCNNKTGMICTSQFIADVNSPPNRYEGQTSYALYSRDDTVVGQLCCGHQCSELKNANLTVVRQGLNHGTIFSTTKDIQYSLIRYHKADI